MSDLLKIDEATDFELDIHQASGDSFVSGTMVIDEADDSIGFEETQSGSLADDIKAEIYHARKDWKYEKRNQRSKAKVSEISEDLSDEGMLASAFETLGASSEAANEASAFLRDAEGKAGRKLRGSGKKALYYAKGGLDDSADIMDATAERMRRDAIGKLTQQPVKLASKVNYQVKKLLSAPMKAIGRMLVSFIAGHALLMLPILLALILLISFLGIGAASDSGYGFSDGSGEALAAQAESELADWRSGRSSPSRYQSFTRIGNQAWCASFVSYCANKVGVDTSVIPKAALVEMHLRQALQSNTYHDNSLYKPERGDLIIWKSITIGGQHFSSPLRGTTSHIGIVVGYDAKTDRVTTIEGNSGNAVSMNSYPRTLCTGYVHPKYAEHISNGVAVNWNGPKLTKKKGTVQGPSGKETYYNMNMSAIVKSLVQKKGWVYNEIKKNGYAKNVKGGYHIRKDGVKMFGPYIMIAAKLSVHPRGCLMPTSLGMGIVVDTGGFAKTPNGDKWIDIATAW